MHAIVMLPPPEKLLEVINLQTEIAQLGLDLGGVMALVAQRTLALLSAEGAAIELAEDGDMVYRACAGITAPHLGLRLKIAQSLSGLAVTGGKTLVCDDAETDARVDIAACRKIGLRSMLVVPLNHKGTIVGVLKAVSVQPHKFSEIEIGLLQLLSEQVAAAMFFATKYDIDDLFYKATHDDLTGLTNRSLFMDRLRALLSSRQAQTIGILMIDMDGLKQVNDSFGHRIGDAIIREFSNRLGTSSRISDTVSRLGGDEFGVILHPVDSGDGIAAAVARINSAIAAPFSFENRGYALSASIGSAQFPDDSGDINALLEIATCACIKRSGVTGRSRTPRLSGLDAGQTGAALRFGVIPPRPHLTAGCRRPARPGIGRPTAAGSTDNPGNGGSEIPQQRQLFLRFHTFGDDLQA
ncbi:sensor domain-containing diguanylate cyclase [Methylomonas koyamae]|uniref:sensor domain-containing diguanylate cyclase n=1 Tax=Methylomonas koyamae TaxID=702114 RepID=UPI00210F6B13|nr:sensor domain-containing diguanylate cyclase [Methylomonas koyamae]